MAGVTLRSATEADTEFLLSVYASTREEELKLVDWPEERKAWFVRQQFEAQSQHYATHYAGDAFQVIERDGEPVGRFYVGRWPSQIRLIDITLLPRCRGTGIGSGLIAELLKEGEARGVPVTIHVEAYNPALRLYQRLGFRAKDQTGVYFLMEWRPGSEAPGPDQVKTAS